MLLALLDGDGDQHLQRQEWELAVELLGVTAANDQVSCDIRRMQLEHLLRTAPARLTDAPTSSAIAPKAAAGRELLRIGYN